MLFNLIQNAIRHTPADGSVTVRAKGGPGEVEVEVADSGEGIPAGEGERVFEAFYRGERSRGEDGAGLGLAISRAIVEAHGGRIWLEDAEPGTRVRFTCRRRPASGVGGRRCSRPWRTEELRPGRLMATLAGCDRHETPGT